MSAQSLEILLQTVGNPVTLARNSQIGPYVYPGYASEFTNWRDEQGAWRESACLFDQSYHMTDMTIQGPDALKLLSAVGVNTFENFAPGKASDAYASSSTVRVLLRAHADGRSALLRSGVCFLYLASRRSCS